MRYTPTYHNCQLDARTFEVAEMLFFKISFKHLLPALRSITMNFIRCSEPFLFKIFRAGATFSIFYQKIISFIINELDTTFKNSSKFIWISQNKSSIFVPSKSIKVLTK